MAGAAVAEPGGRARNGAPGADCEPLVPRGSRAQSPWPAAGGAAGAGEFPLFWWDRGTGAAGVCLRVGWVPRE